MMDEHVRAFVSTRMAETKVPQRSRYDYICQRWWAESISGKPVVIWSAEDKADEHVRLWRARRIDSIRGGVKSSVRLKTIDDIRGRNRAMAELENIGFLKAKMMDSRGVLR